MALINYGEIEKPIKVIEEVLSEYDMEEKALILKFVNQRFVKTKQQQSIQENMEGLKFGGLLKKVMKSGEKEE